MDHQFYISTFYDHVCRGPINTQQFIYACSDGGGPNIVSTFYDANIVGRFSYVGTIWTRPQSAGTTFDLSAAATVYRNSRTLVTPKLRKSVAPRNTTRNNAEANPPRPCIVPAAG